MHVEGDRIHIGHTCRTHCMHHHEKLCIYILCSIAKDNEPPISIRRCHARGTCAPPFRRHLYLTNGELVYRKERKAEELQKQIQLNQMQLELCCDSLNPNAKVYADATKELRELKVCPPARGRRAGEVCLR